MNVDSLVRGRLSSAVDHEQVDVESHLRDIREHGAGDATQRAARRRWTVAAAALTAAGAAVALAVWSFSNHRPALPDYRPTPSVTATPGRTESPSRAPRQRTLPPPSGPQVQAVVRLPSPAAAMASSGGRVWVLGRTGLVRIDPRQDRVHRISVPVPFNLGAPVLVPDDRGGVWFALGSNVGHVDAGGASVKPLVSLPNAWGLALGGGRVWIGTTRSIVALDPATGRRVAAFPFHCSCGSIAFADGSLWMIDFNTEGVDRIDPSTGHVEARIIAADSGTLIVSHAALWALGDPGVFRIDTATNTAQQAASLSSFEGYTAVQATLGDGDIWANAGLSGMGGGDSVVHVIDPSTGHAVGRVDVFHLDQAACRLAVADHTLWEACSGARFDRSGRVVGVVQGPGYVVRIREPAN